MGNFSFPQTQKSGGHIGESRIELNKMGDHGTNYHISPAIHVVQYSTVNNALGDFGYLSFVFTTFIDAH